MTQQAKTSKWGSARFVHINNQEQKETLNLKRAVTLAYRYNDESAQIEFSIAQCSLKDAFCKRIGRSVAYGRLKEGIKAGVIMIPYASLPDLGFKSVTTAVVQSAVTELLSQN